MERIRLLEVALDDLDEFLGCVGRLGVRLGVMRQNVKADVPFQEQRHERIHGSATGRKSEEDVPAVTLLLDGLFETIELATNAADAVEEFLLVAVDMGHGNNTIPRYGIFATPSDWTWQEVSCGIRTAWRQIPIARAFGALVAAFCDDELPTPFDFSNIPKLGTVRFHRMSKPTLRRRALPGPAAFPP